MSYSEEMFDIYLTSSVVCAEKTIRVSVNVTVTKVSSKIEVLPHSNLHAAKHKCVKAGCYI